MRTRIGIAAVALAWVTLAVFAGSSATTSAQALAPCPTGVTMTIAAPTSGATVTTTITPAQNIKAAAQADPNSFHLHYFVDTTAAAAGTVVATGDPKIIHSASLTQDLGALAAGSHTVTVVLGQLDHKACDARATVTFNLAQAVTPPPTSTPAPATPPAGTPTPVSAQVAPPKTGSAGLVAGAHGSNAGLSLLGLVMATVAVVAGARVAKRRD